MRTLTLLVKGGLGNQLFQVGAALEAAAATGQHVKLATPAYALDRKRVCHAATLFPELPRLGLGAEWLVSPLVLDRVARHRAFARWVLSDVNAPLVGRSRDPWTFASGYFQHLRFSDKVASRLRDKLLQEPTVVDTGCIAVHVRRTDFLRIEHLRAEYESLMRDYYRPAIERAAADLGQPAPIVVVSDDPDGAIADLKGVLGLLGPRLERAAGKTVWHDLKQLSAARAVVGSNSTFCWWAARVSAGAVYLPGQWLRRERERPGCDFDLNIAGACLV